MSTFYPDAWPIGLSHHGRAARDPACAVADRRAALRLLRAALDGDSLTEGLRDELLSFCACFVAVPGQETELENEAALVLLPTVQSAAARLAARFPGQAARDLQGDCGSLIWKRLKEGKFKPDKGVFEAWCYTVLCRDLLTRFRRLRPDPLHHAVEVAGGSSTAAPPRAFEPQMEDWRPALERALDSATFLTATFPPGDFDALVALRPENRVVLLCLSGLQGKVPGQDWRQWVEECGATMPFPPEEFAELHTLGERETCLAAGLGLSPAAVRQIWYRSLKSGFWLKLECIRSFER